MYYCFHHLYLFIVPDKNAQQTQIETFTDLSIILHVIDAAAID